MRLVMNKLKNEVEELKDKLDEMEVDRNKARSSQKIAEWKLRKALAALEKEDFDKDPPSDMIKEREHEKERNVTRDIREIKNKDKNEERIRSDESRNKEEIESIQRQIKDLVRKKKEIKKNKTILDRNINNRNTPNKGKPSSTYA